MFLSCPPGIRELEAGYGPVNNTMSDFDEIATNVKKNIVYKLMKCFVFCFVLFLFVCLFVCYLFVCLFFKMFHFKIRPTLQNTLIGCTLVTMATN